MWDEEGGGVGLMGNLGPITISVVNGRDAGNGQG